MTCLRELQIPASSPRTVLVCFPHAGGNPTAYRSWPKLVPDNVAVVGVNYPGRLDRLDETPSETVFELAEEAAAALDRRVDLVCAQNLVFFGHSMGAYVAYETLLRMHHQPDLLAVSGTRTPQRMISRGVVQRGEQAVADDVVHLNAASQPVMDSADLRDLILPTVAADYWAVERYGQAAKPHIVLGIPIRGYSGRSDAIGPPEELNAWMDLTKRPAGVRDFPGGHFYLEDHREELVADLLDYADPEPATATANA